MRLSSIKIIFLNIVLMTSILFIPVYSQITTDKLYSGKIKKLSGKVLKIENNYYFVNFGLNEGITPGMLLKVLDRNNNFIDRLEVKEVYGDKACITVLYKKDRRLRKREKRGKIEVGYIVKLWTKKSDYSKTEEKETLLRRLKDDDYQIRVDAMDVLTEIGGIDIIPEIIEILNEKWEPKNAKKSNAEQNSIRNLRRSAAWALGEVSFRYFSQIFLDSNNETVLNKEKEEVLNKVMNILVNLCKDPDKNVRLSAARNVSRLIAIRQIFGLKNDLLLDPIVEIMLNENDAYVKRAIIDALAELKDERVIEVLIATWDNKDSSVKMNVNWALEKIGQPVVPYMKEILEGSDEVKKVKAIQVLYKLGYLIRKVEDRYEIIE